MKGFGFLGVRGNRSAWRKPTKAGMESATQIHIQPLLAALVKGKCLSIKPTYLPTGVVCHPDTEQIRPYKIPWPCRELNRGPTAPQTRTLPVCHTTPMHTHFYNKFIDCETSTKRNTNIFLPLCKVLYLLCFCLFVVWFCFILFCYVC